MESHNGKAFGHPANRKQKTCCPVCSIWRKHVTAHIGLEESVFIRLDRICCSMRNEQRSLQGVRISPDTHPACLLLSASQDAHAPFQSCSATRWKDQSRTRTSASLNPVCRGAERLSREGRDNASCTGGKRYLTQQCYSKPSIPTASSRRFKIFRIYRSVCFSLGLPAL